MFSMNSSSSSMLNAARDITRTLVEAGHEALFAGGCVRDRLLGRPIKDIDIATSATPDAIEALFPGQTVAVGKSFGVILVLKDSFTFDVATFRSDGVYVDGRHPEAITFATAQEDALRRDFTINGLFEHPETGEVIDYVHGRADLEARILRTIGEPDQRFQEDRLRMLRAIRFASVLGFQIDYATQFSIQNHAESISQVSSERIAKELLRMLSESPKPSVGLTLLLETGLLEQILPEVVAMKDVAQPPKYHPEGDVWTHTLLMLDTLAERRTETGVPFEQLMLGVLLHDIGKPPAFCIAPDPQTGEMRIRFPNHAPMGAAMTQAVLERLKLPSACTDAVVTLVGEHMHFVDAKKMRVARLRRLLGNPYFAASLELMWLDIHHSNKDFSTWEFLHDQYQSYITEPILPEPLIRGRDLLARGFPSGPAMGPLLNDLYDAQLEGRLDEALAALDHSYAQIP
jgi:tRNA nucleotidyltransferase/poly(A) polymerase